jgi:deazaflavin-dependent oxidoreductase (nitroreductase family)
VAAVPRWLTRASRVANLLYDRNLGWLLGHRFLRLTHVGRHSGRRYHTVLEVVGHDRAGPEFFVVSGFGTRADWLRNLDACGPATVTVGRRTFPADHRRLVDAEAYAVLVDYERHHRWIRPVIHRALSWLLGWPYRGSGADRGRLVEQLPVIGLRPHDRRSGDQGRTGWPKPGNSLGRLASGHQCQPGRDPSPASDTRSRRRSGDQAWISWPGTRVAELFRAIHGPFTGTAIDTAATQRSPRSGPRPPAAFRRPPRQGKIP